MSNHNPLSRSRLAAIRGVAERRGEAKPWYTIKGAATEEAHVYIYDEIAWWAVSAEQFVQDLAKITAPVIHQHLNTPGGYVHDGLAIYNALLQHPAKVITHIEGMAASMGSIIALAGDEVKIAPAAFVMIHNPWGIAVGDYNDMLKEAEVLELMGDTMAEVYAAKMGGSTDDALAIMNAETWWNGQQAVEAGLADGLITLKQDEEEEVQAALARFDLSLFAKTPQRLLDMAQGAPQRRRQAGGPPPTKRDAEKALRDAGFSRAQAKAFVAKAWDAQPPREAEADQAAALAELSALARRNIALLGVGEAPAA